MTDAEKAEAEVRRQTFVAALDVSGVGQSELHRRCVAAGLPTSLSSIQRWHGNRGPISVAMLRQMLALMGLPADWTPPPT